MTFIDNVIIKLLKDNLVLKTYYQDDHLVATDLCEGTYIFSVEVDGGVSCFGRYDVTLEGNNLIFNEDLEFQHNLNITNDLSMCSGGGNPDSGEIELNPKIEYPCLTYTWSTGEFTNSISGLTPGMYTVTVTFQYGNEYGETILTFDIDEDEGSVPDFKIRVEEIDWELECHDYGPDPQGSVTVTGIPNTKEYQYVWSNGDIGPTATIVEYGDYPL